MDSNEYYNAMERELQVKKRINQKNYVKKVGDELTIFNSDKKIKEYIESKFFRIAEDYEIFTNLKWNKTKSGLVKISKNNELSFPSIDRKEQRKFLMHIPYSISLYYNEISKQSLINFKHEDWLNYFSLTFFNVPIKSDLNIKLIEDSFFPNNIIPSIENYQREYVIEEKNKDKHFFLYNDDINVYFYMRHHKRHLLFKLTEK